MIGADHLRLRISQDMPLCPHEHHVDDRSSPTHVIVGWWCEGDRDGTEREATLGQRSALDESDAIRAVVSMWARQHDQAVASSVILELLNRLDGAVLMATGLTGVLGQLVAEADTFGMPDRMLADAHRALAAASTALTLRDIDDIGEAVLEGASTLTADDVADAHEAHVAELQDARVIGAIGYDDLLAEVRELIARPITRFGDLHPGEVEAIARIAMRRRPLLIVDPQAVQRWRAVLAGVLESRRPSQDDVQRAYDDVAELEAQIRRQTVRDVDGIAELQVPYFDLAYALGRALDADSPEFWRVVAELERTFPALAWHNAMTDSPAEPPNGFGARVTDSGGGYVTVIVDRDTANYPAVGAAVRVIEIGGP